MASFQGGQKILSGFPNPGLLPVDNGGPLETSLPFASGTVVTNGVTPVAVADTGVTAKSVIILSLGVVGGTPVAGQDANVMTLTPGTGFTVATAAGDTSTYNWVRIG